MNYLVAIDAENDLHRNNTTTYLHLYGISPYPARRPIDEGLRELEKLAVKLGLRMGLGLES